MKTFIKIMLFAGALSYSAPLLAQQKDTIIIDPDPEIKEAAKEVGNKAAEVASKGVATVVDQVYKDKVGPDGQTVYIDNRSRYYYINDKGGKVFLRQDQLKDKPKDNQ